MSKGNNRPDVKAVMDKLKDFQQDTVEYVFDRLYGDNPVSRFLIADEVGLGKTLVARGLIAKAVDHLWDRVKRIDIIYVCANQDIARQNIDRLNITADRRFQLASRLTLLPVMIHQLQGDPASTHLNFVSLTPHTSFNLHSSTGIGYERAVLYWLLRQAWNVSDSTLSNVLRGDKGTENWQGLLKWFERERLAQPIDPDLTRAFCNVVKRKPSLRREYSMLEAEIGSRRKRLPSELRHTRNRWIGHMRQLLAHTCLEALEPDLIILDEFQRFKFLLDKESEIGLLADQLFGYRNAKVLLLSATPYKMYTLQSEEEDHYKDFEHTLSFLLEQDQGKISALRQAVENYRQRLLRWGVEGPESVRAARNTIEQTLRQVMVRTEKLAASPDRNGMIREIKTAQDRIQPDDLQAFIQLDSIARVLRAGDQVEYWKSTSYPLNLMEGYKVKKSMQEALQTTAAPELAQLLQRAQKHLLSWESIEQYQPINPGNARLRALLDHSLGTGNWKLLWMPASLPYYQSRGVFAQVSPERNLPGNSTPDGCTKTVVFSSWRVVPKMIAVLASYEAERQMVGEAEEGLVYSILAEKKKPLLRFTLSKERLTGLPVFCLVYPSMTLARQVDPLATALALRSESLVTIDQVMAAVQTTIQKLLNEATSTIEYDQDGAEDERWYWAALALLDRHYCQSESSQWLFTNEESLDWRSMLQVDREEKPGEEPEEREDDTRFTEHVDEFAKFYKRPEKLGRPPKDLLEVLSLIALAGPAVVSLRALLRKCPPKDSNDDAETLAAAAHVGMGFRALFNQPEVIVLLQGLYADRGPYWQQVLHYSLEGNLQAVMDEYTHVLYESLGLLGHDSGQSAGKIGRIMRQALSIRAPSLTFDEIVSTDTSCTLKSRRLSCRYALRFGTERTEETGERTRDVDIQVAFNSPFRPFILATTSIGQEGLDFHQYCHRIVHWNLPSNPVDLEQREGRIHRYKGHVIRRNLARTYGLQAVNAAVGSLIDPWDQLFNKAKSKRAPGSNDLVPYWIFETDDGYKIERIVPLLPLSREIGQLEQLRKSLVIYRAVIGQPRQEELLAFLSARLPREKVEALVRECTIDLSPPKRKG